MLGKGKVQHGEGRGIKAAAVNTFCHGLLGSVFTKVALFVSQALFRAPRIDILEARQHIGVRIPGGQPNLDSAFMLVSHIFHI
jgi:hypothetical protein